MSSEFPSTLAKNLGTGTFFSSLRSRKTLPVPVFLYGELMRNAGLPLTVGYTGHRWDAAIGHYYAPFRYYNPQTARWNMRDPLGMVDGPNVYAYVAGNPVNYVDTLGLQHQVPGKTCAPRDWPEVEPRSGWKWDKEFGGYRRGGRYAYWHPGGKDKNDPTKPSSPRGHGAPHWEITDKNGNWVGERPNLDRRLSERFADTFRSIMKKIIESVPAPPRPPAGGPVTLPSTQIPWFQDQSKPTSCS